jgi:hypothetical protein
MSQHGRGSGPRDDDPDGENKDTEPERTSGPPCLLRWHDRSLRTTRTGRSPVIGRDCRHAMSRLTLWSRRFAHRVSGMTTPFSPRTTHSAPKPGSSSSMMRLLVETRRRCPNSTSAQLPRHAGSVANRPRRAAVASPLPGRGERPDAVDPAPRASAAGAVGPASRSRCRGSSPDPRSWRTKPRWH